MEQTPSRKTDRRTLYTQTVIKEALLELLHEMSFDKVSIASLCRQAEITRPTFYLHYDNLMQVLDSLIDDALGNPPGLISLDTIKKNRAMLSDLSNLRGMDKKLSLSPCQRGASDPKYSVILQIPHSMIISWNGSIVNGSKMKVLYLLKISVCHKSWQKSYYIFSFMDRSP